MIVYRDYLHSHTTHGCAVLIAVSNLLQSFMRRLDLECTAECMLTETPVSDNFSLLTGNHYIPPDYNVTINDTYLNVLEQNLNAHSIV
jgi:hypothetical protein